MVIAEHGPTILILLLIMIGVGLVGGMAYSDFIYHKKRIKALAPIVHGIATISHQGSTKIEGVFQDAKFWTYYVGNKNRPFVLKIVMFTARRFFHLDLRRENWDTRISKRLGWLRGKVEVGDEKFDSAFLLLTEARDRCKEYFSDQDKRTLLKTIYDQGYTLAFGDEGIAMTIPLQKRVPPAIDTLQLKLAFESLRLLIDDN
jgi:hypothetical protein